MKVFEILVEKRLAPVGSTADLGIWHGGLGALLGDVVKRADGWYFADGTKIKDPRRIAQAEKVHIPPATSAPQTSPRPKAKPTFEPADNDESRPAVHTVVAGDTVYKIARKYDLDVASIMAVNKGFNNETKLSIGQQVKIPSTDVATVPPADTKKPAATTSGEYDLSKFNIHEQRLIKRGVANGMGDLELAAFLAQSAHETQNFKKLTEDTSGAKYEPKWRRNKKTNELRQVNSKARRLGNKKKGDGPLFKGRGYMHMTGRWNYTAAAKELNNPEIFSNPDIVATPSVGLDTAFWYWNRFVRPDVTDWSNITAVTQKVNGGQTGATDRGKYFDKYTKLINAAKQEKKK